jgi:hypothetical protein
MGNLNSTFSVIGATNHSKGERQAEDYYATESKAVDLLMGVEKFSNNIWECAVGGGHLAQKLEEYGYTVFGSDIIDRGYKDTKIIDFLTCTKTFDGDIVTNPPYKYALEFIQKALELIPVGNKVAFFLKLTFLEGQKRRKFFEKNPPKVVYVSSARLNCAKNGDFDTYKSSAMAYAWFVWEKGFTGKPVIEWIN